MKITFDSGPWPMVEIAATTIEFAVLADRIRELAQAGSGEIRAAVDGHGLTELVIRIDAGPVLVAVRDDLLSISGGADDLEGFGLNLPCEPSLPPSYHVHYEHSTREADVAAESIPLVLLVAG